MSEGTETTWLEGPAWLELGEGEVHVWRAALDQRPACRKALAETLSEDERARASRFRSRSAQDRFVVARGILRNILARYLDLAPAQLRFSDGRHGKPALAEDMRCRPLHFNLSHSADLVLVAVAPRAVGIDVERVRPRTRLDRIAGRMFAANEAARLRALPSRERLDMFYRCWTRREALAKAQGEGLRLPLSPFDTAGDSGDSGSRWTLLDVDAAPGYVAALAIEGGDAHVRLWDWRLQADGE